jgi:hypothetical protein
MYTHLIVVLMAEIVYKPRMYILITELFASRTFLAFGKVSPRFARTVPTSCLGNLTKALMIQAKPGCRGEATIAGVEDLCGIRYFIDGVCHQRSKRIRWCCNGSPLVKTAGYEASYQI